MTTIRVEKSKNFVVMSNIHLRERQMSLKAKGLLSLMLSLPPEWDYSIAGLCIICKESQTAIRSTLRELEEFKYLLRTRRQNEKGHFVYDYTIFELPYDGFLYAVERNAEKGHTENRKQLINKEKNINKKNINNKDIKKESGNLEELKDFYGLN